MSDPVISPNGKWMWTGNEWIPAPPSSNHISKPITDEVIVDDLRAEQSQNSNPNHASISLHDSVVTGDVNITQNNLEEITGNVITKYWSVLVSQHNTTPMELNHSEEQEVSRVLEILGVTLAQNGEELNPWIMIRLGKAAELAGMDIQAENEYRRDQIYSKKW